MSKATKDPNVLSRCPFCGSYEIEITLTHYIRRDGDHDWYGKIRCGHSSYSGGCGVTIESGCLQGHKKYATLINGLTRAWNTRPTPTKTLQP